MKSLEADIEFTEIGIQEPRTAGWDEPPPLNVSAWLWLQSGCSQRIYEAEVLGMGKN